MAIFIGCSEDLIVIDDNLPYSTFNISDIKIRNYVNRIYIDIIGREPLDAELESVVVQLKEGGLKREAREQLIYMLMTDTTYRENEYSYKAAFVQNLYNHAKVRCLEGVSDEEIQLEISILSFGALQDSLLGKWDNYYDKQNIIRNNQDVLFSREAMYDGLITYHQMYGFMINNSIYDRINMNTFNFIRATFDQLLFRLPTQQEFNECFPMIQYNQAGELFGQSGSNKNDYIQILTESNEMLEGMLIWCYQVLLSRPPSAAEVITLLPDYLITKDIRRVFAQIMVTDEYANFR
jgi:hypothetical protein